MERRYLAFGLELWSEFALPGLPGAGTPGIGAIRLTGAAWGTPAAALGGGEVEPIWRGRLGDGTAISIARGAAGDLLFSDGERGEYRLTPDRRRLECALRDPAAPGRLRTLLSRVLPNVSLALGNQALHAAAVTTPAGVVGILAPSGTGKSTLAASLRARGHRHFTDDVLVLADGAGAPVAHPGAPYATLPLAVGDGEAWTRLPAVPARPLPLAALFLYARGPDLSFAVERLPASPLHLAPYMLGIPGEGGEAARFSLYSDLVESTPLFALRADPGRRPEEIADLVEATLSATGAEEPTPVGATV